jgi:hypothetical protein
MEVSVQLTPLGGFVWTPPNVTVLPPWVAPKLVPVIVTDAPIWPVFGDKLVMAGVTAKALPLLSTPAVETTMFPLVAPAGTGTTIEASPHVVTAAVVPLKVTLLPVT